MSKFYGISFLLIQNYNLSLSKLFQYTNMKPRENNRQNVEVIMEQQYYANGGIRIIYLRTVIHCCLFLHMLNRQGSGSSYTHTIHFKGTYGIISAFISSYCYRFSRQDFPDF